MTNNWNSKFKVGLALALVLALVVTLVALADYVVNNIDTTIDPALESRTITTGGSTSVGFYIQPNNSDPNDVNGCNATGANPATVTLSVPADVTASTTSLSFTGCGVTQNVTFSSSTAGTYTISVASVSGGKAGSAWDTTSASFTLVVLAPADSTPPVITPNVSGTLGNNGWYTSNVTVSWTVSDPESAISSSSGCGTTNITSDTTGTTLTCSATSAGGTNSQSVTIKRDATAPTVNASALPGPNINGWNNTDVTVSYTCTDNGPSGVDAGASSLSNDVLTASGTASGTCVDNAGNSASASYTAQIDKDKPVITGSRTPPANGFGWNNTDVVVSFTCADSGSGIDTNTVAGATVNGEGAGQSVTNTGTCTDKAGNTADSATVSGINIDKTAPTITGAPDRTANANGWYNADVTVSFTCNDALSGVDSCSGPTTLGEGAGQSVTGNVTDQAGNSASATVSDINIDKTAPNISGSGNPAANSFGWNNTDVTVSFSCTDALSGVDGVSGPTTLSGEGAGQSVTGTCADKAGNSASATVSDINIDKTAPSVALVGGPANGGSYYFGFVPAAPTCSASDVLSGLDGTCSVSGYSTAVGSHTVTASATDKAGNTASASNSYTVLAWTLTGFYAPVDMSPGAPTTIVWNVVKGGSTVPLKFEIFAGLTELTDTSYVTGFTATPVACSTGTSDAIEVTATGGTSLRYDTTAGQFIYNWKTPKTTGCYKITMTTQDGSMLFAYFQLK